MLNKYSRQALSSGNFRPNSSRFIGSTVEPPVFAMFTAFCFLGLLTGFWDVFAWFGFTLFMIFLPLTIGFALVVLIGFTICFFFISVHLHFVGVKEVKTGRFS